MKAIQRMAISRGVKGIQRLLRSLNYYRRFDPEMAECLVLLNNLFKKGKEVVVTPDEDGEQYQAMHGVTAG